jgi:hypothetical protein
MTERVASEEPADGGLAQNYGNTTQLGAAPKLPQETKETNK